jgi:hypothetical protein
MTTMPQFDVFLSHSSVDKPWVIQLKDDLLRYGVSVWLDRDEIRPGDLFVDALEQALDQCRAVALIISPASLRSGWVKEEYHRALSLAQSKQTPLQLIPVILQAAEPPGFLKNRSWIDFRDESAYADNVWRLVWGITGHKPARVLDLSAPAPPPQSAPAIASPKKEPAPTENPFFYGGAVPPDLFYGRQEMLQAIVARVGGRTAQSISIVGERRMGKTSLLQYLKARADQLFTPELNRIIIYLDLMQAKCHTRTGLMRSLRRELTRLWREPWPKAEDGDLAAFDFALEDLRADGIRLILCLDEVEHLTQRAAEFNDVLEDWRACGSLGHLALVTASAQALADLCASGGLTSPFYNIFAQHWLGLLEPLEWQALVTGRMAATPDDLAFIDQVAGGQPFLTQMAAHYLWAAKTRGGVDYDQLYQELWFQAKDHLAYQWRKLTPAEQATLRRLATGGAGRPDPKQVAALARRGLVRNDRPSSQLLADLVQGMSQ